MSRNIVTEIMSETIVYGGLRATRAEVYFDWLKQGGTPKQAEYLACRPGAVAVDPESVAHLPSFVEVREQEEKERPFREWCGEFLTVYRSRLKADFVQPWESIRKYFSCGYLPETAVYELTRAL